MEAESYNTAIISAVPILELKLLLMGGFGIWVFTTMDTFDRSPDACTSSTMVWIFGHHVHATTSGFRYLMLTVYSISTIPFLNSLVVTTVTAFLLFVLTKILMIARRVANTSVVSSHDKEVILTLALSLTYNVLVAILITLTEAMINSNNIEPQEEQWGLGQTYAIILAIFVVVGLVRPLFRKYPEVRQDRTTSIESSSSHGGNDVEQGLALESLRSNHQQSDDGIEHIPAVTSRRADFMPNPIIDPSVRSGRNRSNSV